MRPDPEQVFAGLSCGAVLERLSAYADGDIDRDVATAIEAHVSQCRQCEQFGAAFVRLLQTMRARLREPQPVPSDIAARLLKHVGS